jgi:N-methylhydantoinase A/oxoprolinase/acetone carboxylase beta subunit
MYEEMATQATAVVRDAAVAGTVALVRSVDARYVGQGYELTVSVPPGPLDSAALARIRAAFDEIYAARYGYASPAEPVETVTWKLAAVGGAPRVALAKAPAASRDGGLKDRRRAWFPETRGWTESAVYDRYSLAPGSRLDGPAIIEERESTSVLPPGTSASVDEYANLIVTVERA